MVEFFRGKCVAITGASGLVGSYLVKAFAESGANVRAIVHLRQPNEFTNLAFEKRFCDLSVLADTREAIRGADAVVHAAGVTGGIMFAAEDPGERVAPNAIMVASVIHACAKEKIERLGLVSSAAIYPPANHPSKEEEAWITEPPPRYQGPYLVEHFAEQLSKYYSANYDIKITILRPSNVYGRYDNFNPNSSHVLPALLRKAVNGEDPLVIWSDGKEIRDFLHASDLARAMLLGLEKYTTCDPVNIGSEEPVTIEQLARLLLELVHSNAKLVFDDSKPASSKLNAVNIEKARSVLGYRPKMNLRDGISDMLEWYKST